MKIIDNKYVLISKKRLNFISEAVNLKSKALNFDDDSVVIMTRIESDGKAGVETCIVSPELIEDQKFDLIKYLEKEIQKNN